MNKSYFNILLLFVLVTIVAVLLEYKYKNYQNPADLLFVGLEKDAPTINEIYIGGSHTAVFGTYSSDSSKVIRNLSFQGFDLFKINAIIKKWQPKMTDLKTIYLGLDYEMLGQNQAVSGEAYLDRQFFPYIDTLYNYNVTNLLMSKSNFFRSNRDLSYLFQRSNQKKITTPNFIPLGTKKENLNDKACKQRATEHSLIKFKKQLLNQNITYLNDLITTCKKNNIQLIIFNPPKTACFKDYEVKENVTMAKFKIDSLLTENQIKYYDFCQSTDFEDGDFNDYDHLNTAACKRLIAILNKERLK